MNVQKYLLSDFYDWIGPPGGTRPGPPGDYSVNSFWMFCVISIGVWKIDSLHRSRLTFQSLRESLMNAHNKSCQRLF